MARSRVPTEELHREILEAIDAGEDTAPRIVSYLGEPRVRVWRALRLLEGISSIHRTSTEAHGVVVWARGPYPNPLGPTIADHDERITALEQRLAYLIRELAGPRPAAPGTHTPSPAQTGASSGAPVTWRRT